ncbi:DUF6713 family protein [Lysobacter koreensis]|uniref:DUF6713 family protein n=1 Tax=Lysobacter koreensis TaxID=266122 RepID=A0ABW2YHS8_9GAMM
MLSLNHIIVLNLALVLTHQVDAAFWREWEMFGLLGGIQLFNALNVVIFLVVLSCFVAVIQRRPSGFRCSLAIALLCASVLPIHAAFALSGFSQFHLPFSVFLIVATFLVSIVQVALTVRARQEFGGRMNSTAGGSALSSASNITGSDT